RDLKPANILFKGEDVSVDKAAGKDAKDSKDTRKDGDATRESPAVRSGGSRSGRGESGASGSRPSRSGGSSATRSPRGAVPKITDFGLAKNLETDSGLTGSGTILGTPSYMAPEQAAGRTRAIGP